MNSGPEPSAFSALLSRYFDEVGISARVLSKLEVVELDERIRKSGDVRGGSLGFSTKVRSIHLDANNLDEVRDFLAMKLRRYEGTSLLVLEDTNNHGFELSFHGLIQSVVEILRSATGHIYILDDKFRLVAIVKIPLWTSVRVD